MVQTLLTIPLMVFAKEHRLTDMSRREFLARTALGGMAGAAALSTPAPAYAAGNDAIGTVIDLSLCDGCGACVSACTTKNETHYPRPVDDIPVNWPTGKFEDWQKMEGKTDRLTPYNWLYVEKVEVDGTTVSVPRRCMHCDEPPCANLCPFGAQEQTAQGAVVIDHEACLGGAKCRSVCPWSIPQRQAGVGVYMDLAPGLLGGGVMYKCDGCADLLAEGKTPACVSACPTGAMKTGPKAEMLEVAKARAAAIGGHIYGDTQNGGTSTFYVSPVSFEAIDAAIAKRRDAMPEPQRVGVPRMQPDVDNYLDSANGTLKTMALAPVLGMTAAVVAATKSFKKGASS